VMYTQLTLVICNSAIRILTFTILFHCHEEQCSISRGTAEIAHPNHSDCVMLLPTPSPSCSLFIQWVIYFMCFQHTWRFSSAKSPHVLRLTCVCVTEREKVQPF
jgi:hypothetical protein